MNLLGFLPAILGAVAPPWLMAGLRAAFTFIPVPLIAFPLAYGWWQIDKGSAVRQAVDGAISDFTGATEKAALEARLDAERALSESLRISIQFRDRQIARDQKALAELQAAARLGELQKQDLQDEIDEILAARVGAVPSVGALGVLGRLRNR